MIGQVAIDLALLEFNDLGHTVTLTFLFRNRFYLQLSLFISANIFKRFQIDNCQSDDIFQKLIEIELLL